MFNFFYNSFIIILLYNNLSSKKYLHLGKKIPNDAAIIAKMSILIMDWNWSVAVLRGLERG
jgi:hypothetical protein